MVHQNIWGGIEAETVVIKGKQFSDKEALDFAKRICFGDANSRQGN